MRGNRRRRLGAWVLLATFACALGSSQLSADHFGIVDTACGEVEFGGGAGPRVGVAVDVPAEHCPVCHFLRAVNGAAVSTMARQGVPEFAGLLTVPPTPARVVRRATILSSRGPPALLPSTACFC